MIKWLQWILVRWFYRTQADTCGSRAIEWFRRSAHRCWSPLPTYRIACDAGSDDLLGRCAIRFAPCLRHQAKLSWLVLATSGNSIPLPQREAAGFHYAPLSCFSQCQWGSATALQMMACSMALPNAGWRLRNHSVNEVRLLLFKWWLARWLYRTQADACGSRAIEWFRLYLGRYFRLIAFYAMPEVTTFCEKCAIRFVPCLRHQAKPGWLAFATSGGLQSIATERSIRVSLRSTLLFLTVSMRLGSWSSNDDLLDGSTERRLTLAEVEPSNGLGGQLTDLGHHFRLIVLHAMPEVTTFWEDVPSGLLHVCDTKQSTADCLRLLSYLIPQCRFNWL